MQLEIMTESAHSETDEKLIEDGLLSPTPSGSTESWGRGRIRVVAMCALAASLGSVLIGSVTVMEQLLALSVLFKDENNLLMLLGCSADMTTLTNTPGL